MRFQVHNRGSDKKWSFLAPGKLVAPLLHKSCNNTKRFRRF